MIELLKTPRKSIWVDVIPSFTLDATAEQTDYAVEDGSSRSDHKIINPKTLELELAQSEQPLDDPQYSKRTVDVEPRQVQTVVTSPFLRASAALGAAATAIVGALRTPAPAKRHEVLGTNSPRNRGGELEDELLALLASDDLVSITFKGRTYTGVSLVGLNASSAPGSVGLTRFRCSFKELKKEVLETVLIPNPEDLAFVQPKSTGKGSGKNGSDENPEDKVGEKPKSLLASGLDLF